MTPTQRSPVLYALGNVGTNTFLQAFSSFILFFYVDHLGAALGPITLFLSLQAIWHAVLNPVTGAISDHTRTRLGRRVPYVLFGALPLGAVFFWMWDPQGPRNLLPLDFAVSVGLFDLLYLLVVINWTSLFPEMFRTIGARTHAQTTRQAAGILGLIVGVALPPVLYTHLGFPTMGFLLAAVGTAGFLLSVLGARDGAATMPGRALLVAASDPSRDALETTRVERANKPVQPVTLRRLYDESRATLTNQSFLSYLGANFLVQFGLTLIPAALPFFGKYVLHIQGLHLTVLLGVIFVVALAALPVWSRVIRRMGTRHSVTYAVCLMGLGIAPYLWLSQLSWAYASAIVVGCGLSGFLSLADVLIAEIIDEDASRSGTRREGSFFGVNGFVVRMGVTLEASLFYAFLGLAHYVPNAAGVATPAVILALRMLTAGVPLVAFALALVCFRGLRVPESPRQIPGRAVEADLA